MALTSRLVFLAILSVGVASPIIFSEDSEYQQSLSSYIVSLVKYLASQQAGTFDCWLYHACTHPPGKSRLLQDIYVGLENESITRLSANGRFNWSLVFKKMKQPSLVIYHLEFLGENRTLWANGGHLIGSLTSQAKIVMITGVEQWSILDTCFIPTFSEYKLYDVVFFFTDQPLVIAPNFVKQRYVGTKTFWPPKDMFPSQTRSLEGQPFRYSLVKLSVLNACPTTVRDCIGYDVSLAKEIARFLNATPQFVQFDCPYEPDAVGNRDFNCIYRLAYDVYCPFDFFVEPAVTTLYEPAYIEVPIPFDNVFLAPSGRSLNIAELFLKPFQFELWCLFFIGLITVKVMSIMIPNSFKNDPLFLPICGFEQYDLNRTSRMEKLVMISLIVMFFFISNAYETKIISLMSSKPRVKLVSTLQSILDSGTTVKSEYYFAQMFPMFESLFDTSNINEDQLDGTSVYLVNGDVGLLLVQRMINWDYESNQPRYRIMEERFAMGVGFYPIPLRSPARPHYRFVLKALFEAGILIRWRHEYIALSNSRRFPLIKPGGVNPTSDILHFSDLLPAWFVVWCGSILSIGVLIYEILYVRRFAVNHTH